MAATTSALIRQMVIKDLLRRRRAPLSVLVMLAFPVLFAGLIALTFGRSGDAVPKVKLLIEDRDGELVGTLVRGAFGNEEMARYFTVEEVGEEGVARLEAGEASALLRLPAGLTDALLDGQPATLELVRNPAQSILPEIAEQISSVLAEVLSSAAYLLRGPLEQIRPLRDLDEAPPDATVATIAVSVNQLLSPGGKYLFPPVIQLETAKAQEAEESADKPGTSPMVSIFLFILPGVAVYSIYSLGDLAMRDLLVELRLRTLHRQLASPAGAGTVVAAKLVVTALIALLSLLLLAGLGAVLLGRGVDPAGFVVLSLLLVVSVAGMSALIYGLAGSEKRGSTVGTLVYLVLAFSGGSFLPLDNLPASVRAVAPASPFYWATEGYRQLLDGATLLDLGPHCAVLALLGLLLLAVGVQLLQRRVRLGVLA